MLAISGCGNLEILRFNVFLQFSEVQSLPQWAHVSYIMKRHIKVPYINMYMTIGSWSYTGQIQRCPHPRCFETEKLYPGQVLLSPFIIVLTWNTHVAWPLDYMAQDQGQCLLWWSLYSVNIHVHSHMHMHTYYV